MPFLYEVDMSHNVPTKPAFVDIEVADFEERVVPCMVEMKVEDFDENGVKTGEHVEQKPSTRIDRVKIGSHLERLTPTPPRILLHVAARDEAHCRARVAQKWFNPILGIVVLHELDAQEIAEAEVNWQSEETVHA